MQGFLRPPCGSKTVSCTMNEVHERDEAVEPWFALSNWEQQCVEELENSPDLETQIDSERNATTQKLWFQFQNAATCVAQLYKDRQHGVTLWVPFQNAAGSVTNLYKECLESQKRFGDLGYQCGYQRRNRDLLAWAKKRKRHIRREDLIAFLTGKTPPSQRSWVSPRQRLSIEGLRSPSHHSRFSISNPVEPEISTIASAEPDLETFREALAFSSISGAVGNSNFGIRQHSPGSSPSGQSRGHRSRISSQNNLTELNAFISEEFIRHSDSRKRAPSTDVVMDSPTHKRSRLAP
ncbi:HUWE1-associated protein modifying stress responses isoform X2 [Tachypleus tridentatus]|uniref:HUWE1-associated protein modifying stress responses isoform X2 n=1 Tax=Tachypleus tridentatus TaxID=6853 RepID=UPI003FCFF73A